jgi:hypothetical protein
MRQLFSQIKAAGYESVFQYGGITVMLGSVTIALGPDGEAFTAYVQQDLEEGPVFTSVEGLTLESALQLCSRYASTATVAA